MVLAGESCGSQKAVRGR